LVLSGLRMPDDKTIKKESLPKEGLNFVTMTLTYNQII
jgi:hypothetical protein